MECLHALFPQLSQSKIKPGVFNGPDIRKGILKFDLGRTIIGSSNQLVDEMMSSFKRIGVNMSLKIHFLNQHLNNFQENLYKLSDQHREIFH